jgi:putative transposase
VAEALSLFSNNRTQAINQYLRFMKRQPEEAMDENIEKYEHKISPVSIKKEDDPIRLSLDEIIDRVCTSENVSIDQITRKTKARRISDIRKAIVLLSEKHCSITNMELAQRLNLPPSMVSKIKSDETMRTPNVDGIMRRCE